MKYTNASVLRWSAMLCSGFSHIQQSVETQALDTKVDVLDALQTSEAPHLTACPMALRFDSL